MCDNTVPRAFKQLASSTLTYRHRHRHRTRSETPPCSFPAVPRVLRIKPRLKPREAVPLLAPALPLLELGQLPRVQARIDSERAQPGNGRFVAFLAWVGHDAGQGTAGGMFLLATLVR